MTHSDSNRFWHGARVLLLLAALAYLGFYFYGLVMGVFSPLELVGFTIAAAAMIAAILLISVRARLGVETDATDDDARKARSLRERRGF